MKDTDSQYTFANLPVQTVTDAGAYATRVEYRVIETKIDGTELAYDFTDANGTMTYTATVSKDATDTAAASSVDYAVTASKDAALFAETADGTDAAKLVGDKPQTIGISATTQAAQSVADASMTLSSQEAGSNVTDVTDQLSINVIGMYYSTASGKYQAMPGIPPNWDMSATTLETIGGMKADLSFKILKDDSSRSIKAGDYFTFKLDQKNAQGDYYFNVPDVASTPLTYGGQEIATCSVANHVVTVTFSKAVNYDEGFTTIKGGFQAAFSLNAAAFSSSDSTKVDITPQTEGTPSSITFGPKTSSVSGITKSGTFDPATRSIIWTITAGTGSNGIDLSGTLITDTYDTTKLEYQSAWMGDSNPTKGTAITMGGDEGSKTYSIGSAAGTSTTGPVTIYVKTAVKDDALPTNADVVLGNKAQMTRGSSSYTVPDNTTATSSVTVPHPSVTKTGQQVDGDEMLWTIVINDVDTPYTIFNAQLTDTFSAPMSYVKDSMQMDGKDVSTTTSSTSDYVAITTDASGNTKFVYNWINGDQSAAYKNVLSAKHTLTYRTKITDTSDASVKVTNNASLTGNWPTYDGKGPGKAANYGIPPVGATYDYAYIDKSGTADSKTGQITWTVKPSSKNSDWTTATISDAVADTTGTDGTAITQTFVADSVSLVYGTTNYTQQQLVHNGWLAIGTDANGKTLLTWTLPKATFANLGDVSISYKTIADNFLKEDNISRTYSNTANIDLKVGDKDLTNSGTGTVVLSNDLVDKTGSYSFDDTTNKGYLHYTITFNKEGLTLTNASVTDDLSKLEATYTNSAGKNVSIASGDWTIDPPKTVVKKAGTAITSGYTINYTNNNVVCSFAGTVSDTYTIDLYLSLKDQNTVNTYMKDASGNITTKNTASATGKEGNIDVSGSTTYTSTGKGDIQNKLVTKDSKLKDATSTSSPISWRVDANPNATTLTGATITDTLPATLQLKYDSAKLYKSKHADNGSVSTAWPDNTWTEVTSGWKKEVTPGSDGSTVLTVTLPDSSQAYTLVYDTMVVDQIASGSVSNNATFKNGEATETASHDQTVNESAWGYLTKTASCKFQKVDLFGGTAMPLAGVSFSLYTDAEHTQQVAGPVFADNNGYFAFYGLPVSSSDPNWHATYYYQEDATSVPTGYVQASGSFTAETKPGTYSRGMVSDARTVNGGNFAFQKMYEGVLLGDATTKSYTSTFGLQAAVGGKTTTIWAIRDSDGAYTYSADATANQSVGTTGATTAFTTAAGGKLAINGLPWGDYKMSEQSTQPGFACYSGTKSFTVAKDGTITYTDFAALTADTGNLPSIADAQIALTVEKGTTDNIDLGGVALSIYTDAAHTVKAKNQLTGSDLTITIPDNTTGVFTWNSDSSPVLSALDGPTGADSVATYYLVEDTGPKSTELALFSPVKFTVDKYGAISGAGVSGTTLSVTDSKITVNLGKLDQFGNGVNGAIIQLQKWNANTSAWVYSDSWTTASATPAKSFSVDRNAKYRFVETSVPAGYLTTQGTTTATDNYIEFSVDEYGAISGVNLDNPESLTDVSYGNLQNGSLSTSTSNSFTMRDELIVGQAQFVKYDSTTSGKIFKGKATFDLYKQGAAADGSADAKVNEDKTSFTSDATTGLVTTVGSTLKNKLQSDMTVGQGLEPGTYYFQETSTAADFKLPSDAPKMYFTVSTDGSNRYTWRAVDAWGAFSVITAKTNAGGDLSNTPLDASVRVKKVATDKTPLPGATFTLEGKTVKGEKYSQNIITASDDGTATVADADGTEHKYSYARGEAVWGNVPAGTYTLKETTSPEGYKCASESYTVTVSQTDGTVTYALNGVSSQVVPTVTDEPYSISIAKYDADGTTQIGGAQFTIAGVFADGTETGGSISWCSDATNAKSLAGELVAGNEYTLSETAPASGYVISSWKSTYSDAMLGSKGELVIKIDTAGNLQYKTGTDAWTTIEKNAIAMKDAKNSVSVTKVDLSDPTKLLEGAKFKLSGIFAGGNNVESSIEWISSAKTAEVIEGKLIAGNHYQLTETVPAEGYTVAKDMLITVDASGTLSVYNDETGKYDSYSNPAIAVKDIPTYLSVEKQGEPDSTGKAPTLAGAQFTLSGIFAASGGSEGSITWTSSATEAKMFKGELVAGNVYKLHEDTPVAGYTSAADAYLKVDNDGYLWTCDSATGTFVRSADTIPVHYIVNDAKSSVTLKKVGEDGSALDGSAFTITGTFAGETSSSTVDLLASGSEGTLTGKLVAGNSYTVHEKTLPAGYTQAPDFTFTVANDGAFTLSGTPAGVTLEGSTFTVKDAQTNIVIKKTDRSTGDQLPNHDKCDFRVSPADATTTFVDPTKIYLEGNDDELTQMLKGQLRTTRVVAGLANQSMTAQALTAQSDSTSEIETIDGTLTVSETPNIYQIKEIREPGGYQIEPSAVQFIVDQYGDMHVLASADASSIITSKDGTISLSFSDPTIKATFVKTDTSGTKLAGATFKLEGTFASGSSTTTTPIVWTSSDTAPSSISDGFVDAKLIAGQTYMLTETSAPAGYDAASSPITFTVDNKGLLTLTSDADGAATLSGSTSDSTGMIVSLADKTTVTPPDDTKTNLAKTSDDSSSSMPYLVITLASACMIAIIEVVRRRRTKDDEN